MRYRAVRCVLFCDGYFLLAVHNTHLPQYMGKWGLPGGHIDAGETFQMTATREMHEEFGLSLNEWCDVNEYLYQGAYQKVLGTRYEGSKDLNHDTGEILDIAWYTLAEIQKMHLEKEVRTGFEVDATAKFLKSCEHLIKH